MPRRNKKKKTSSPVKKPGRGIRRQTGTVDWESRPSQPPSPKPGRFIVPTLHGPSTTLSRHPHYSSPLVLESLGSASTPATIYQILEVHQLLVAHHRLQDLKQLQEAH